MLPEPILHLIRNFLVGNPFRGQPDDAVWAAVWSGDQADPAYGQALCVLLERAGGTVYAVCRRHLGPGADAEDVFQDAVIALIRKPPRRVGTFAAARAWLCRVARNKAVDRLNQRHATGPVGDDQPATAADPSPDDRLDAVLAAVARLKEKYRVPFQLSAIDGLTAEAIGRRLGLTAEAAQKRVERARGMVLHTLAGRGVAPAAAGAVLQSTLTEVGRAGALPPERAAALADSILTRLTTLPAVSTGMLKVAAVLLTGLTVGGVGLAGLATLEPAAQVPPGGAPGERTAMRPAEATRVVGLDPTFGTGGTTTIPLPGFQSLGAAALQPDGKVVAVGATNPTGQNGHNDWLVVRFNADGTHDTAFNGGTGLRVFDFGGNDQAGGVAVQPDGKIVVVGRGEIGGGASDFCVVRLKPDGTPDEGFGRGGGVVTVDLGGGDVARAVALQSTGRIVVAGHTDRGRRGRFAAVALAPDGTPDAAFNRRARQIVPGRDGGWGRAFALAVYRGEANRDGFLVAGRENADFAVARYHADGTPDGPVRVFDLGGNETANGVAIAPDGNVVLAGHSDDRAGGWSAAALRLNPDLTPDPAFGPGNVAGRAKPGAAFYSSAGRVGADEGSAGVLVDPAGAALVVAGSTDLDQGGTMMAARLGSEGSPALRADGALAFAAVPTRRFSDPAHPGGRQSTGYCMVAAPGGRVIVVGHAGGKEDADAAAVCFTGLIDDQRWVAAARLRVGASRPGR